jgi:hypothetical protein
MAGSTVERETMLLEDRAFNAFLAALVRQGMGQIAGASMAVHDAFKAALEVLQEDERIAPYFKHFYASRSTGRVDELDQALIRGEAAGTVLYGNPTYSRIQISLSPFEVEELLSQFAADRAVFSRAAEVFQERFSYESW